MSSTESTQQRDDVLDRALPIIDPHHHIWTTAHGKFEYLIPELLADVNTGHNIVQTVYCECKSMFRQDGPVELRPVGETEFVLDAVSKGGPEANSLCTGLVMYADLSLGDAVQSVLDAHREVAGTRLKGIRNIVAHDPSPEVRSFVNQPGLLARPSLREGVACLARNGLVFETFVFHRQLGELAAFASALPDATIVVDGLGGPLGVGPYKGRRHEVFDEWRASIRALARHDNVHIHIGAFGAKMFGLGFHKADTPPTMDQIAAAWSPYFEVCLEAFGPARCMLTSNYPEDRSSISYRQLWNVYKRMATHLSHDERSRIFSETSAQVYDLS
ncbi:amidohydrolase family protein [Burkholderia pseudomultivorans]|uniref:Amidohydrolase-related domain-containing protein n=1 Tax=Burkholderia pseudomultivorans TaxID=1207504 RepID=A0A132EA13_9BURK|nr:amidohydrolase family protein [Burkholderia pseudomultivorans]KWF22786.1 hypothetical protein WT56_01175 [Burkholderia pseudomultivorans]